MITGPIELYDVLEDIAEKNDLAKRYPEIVSRFERKFTEAHAPAKRWRPSGKARDGKRERSEGR
jgi:hypothetical protein